MRRGEQRSAAILDTGTILIRGADSLATAGADKHADDYWLGAVHERRVQHLRRHWRIGLRWRAVMRESGQG